MSIDGTAEAAGDGASDGANNGTGDSDALVERLAVIEQQPLEARAGAFQQLHDELQRELEGGHSE